MVTRQIKQKLEDGTEIVVDIGAKAEHVETDSEHRFVSDAEKEAWGKAVSGDYIGGQELSEEANTEDARAQYTVLQKTTAGTEQAMFTKTLEGLPLGMYSVMLRAKVSQNTGTDAALDIKIKVAGDGGLLKEAMIKPSMFSAVDKFQTLGFIVDFDAARNEGMQIEASMPAYSSADAAVTVTVDYVLIAPAYTAVSSIG